MEALGLAVASEASLNVYLTIPLDNNADREDATVVAIEGESAVPLLI
jgi:hypothetical protein